MQCIIDVSGQSLSARRLQVSLAPSAGSGPEAGGSGMSDATPFGVPMVEELLATSFLKPLLGSPPSHAAPLANPSVNPLSAGFHWLSSQLSGAGHASKRLSDGAAAHIRRGLV